MRVEIDGPAELLRLRTIHHVIALGLEGEVRSIAEIEHLLSGIELGELESAASFRVSSKRRGNHDFKSGDIERAAGGVLHRRYGTPVDLEEFAVEVRVDLIGTRLFAGVQITPGSLGQRILRSGTLRSALKPTVAAAMLRLAGAHRGRGRLLDPLCGSGTIPVEAQLINPLLEVSASDWDADTVEIARQTVANHGLAIEVQTVDARSLKDVYPLPFDYIVTDPPYGVRQAKHTSRSRLYGSLLSSFEEVLAESGKIALVVLKYQAFVAALERSRLRIVDERRVELGRITPRILVLERR